LSKNKREPRRLKHNLPVRDARKDLVLHITEADLQSGKRRDNDHCAAANALCRQENFKSARVFKGVTYVMHKDGTITRYITPKNLYIELMIFDRGGRMEAGDYKLTAARGTKRLGHHEKPRGKGGNTGRSSRPVHIVPKVRDDAPKGIKSLQSLFE
jgi:hypothetical protein